MGIISNLFSKSHDLMDSRNGWTSIFGNFFAGSARSATGKNITPELAMQLSAYFAAIAAISEDVGKLPLITYKRRTTRGRDAQPQHPVYDLLKTKPNDKQTAMVFIEQLTAWALGWGFGYAEIVRNVGGDVVALHPIHPGRVIRPKTGQNKTDDYHVHCQLDGKPRIVAIPESDILAIPGRAGGLSIAQFAANSIGIALAADEYAAVFYKNFASIGGIIEYPTKLKKESIENLRESWASEYAGSSNAHKTPVLEAGVKWQSTAIPNKDSQFIESRHFQIEEIARWFRVPPHKLQELGKSTFSNIEQQSIEYVSDTLQPWMTRWEQEIRRKLFADEPDYYADFLVAALLQGDSTARSNFYKTLFNLGAFSPNDIREKENLNPIDDPAGDQYFIQLNMSTLERVAAGEPEPADDNKPDEPDEEDEEETPVAFEDDEPTEESKFLSALIPMADAAIERVLAKELKACERIIKKNSDRDDAKQAVSAFLSDQIGYLQDELTPLADSIRTMFELTDPLPDFKLTTNSMVATGLKEWGQVIDFGTPTETAQVVNDRAYGLQMLSRAELLEYIKTKDKDE